MSAQKMFALRMRVKNLEKENGELREGISLVSKRMMSYHITRPELRDDLINLISAEKEQTNV